MFIERLVAGLSAPQNRLGELDDALVLDVDHYRALLMREARGLSEVGDEERAVAGWAFTCIAEGWVDDHLQTVRDSLLELGAVADQAHLDRMLHAAVLRILGLSPALPTADELVLDTVTRPTAPPGTLDAEPLGLRLHVRHYALELGLLSRASGVTERTPLGDTALRLPRHNLPGYLLALEMLQSAGLGDRWRTPRRALAYMSEAREFDIPTSTQARRHIDPEGLVPWRRVRRLTLMGLCEAAPDPGGDEERCRYRLLPYGEDVLRTVLREPPTEVVRLAQAMLAEQTRQALRPLLVKSRALEALRFAREGAPRREAAAEVAGVPATMRPAVTTTLGTRTPGSEPERAPPAEPEPAVEEARSEPPARAAQAPLLEELKLPLDQSAPVEAPLPAARPPATEAAPAQAPPRAAPRAAEPPPLEPSSAGPPWSVSPELPAAEHRSPDPPQGLGEPGQPELELGQLVQRAWDEIQARQVRFTLHGPSVRVSADRRALLQALRELLRSAADAAQLGPVPMVSVEIQPDDEEAVLLVHDNGPPLSTADRDGVLDVSWGLLTEGPRTGLLRAHRVLRSQGLALQLPQPKLGGTTARVQLPRVRCARRAAA